MDNRFADIIQLIKQSRSNAIKAVNAELINLYWNIGEYINKKIEQSGWGDSVVKELANFIQTNEPEIKGFSDKNIWRMKQFYETYKDFPKLSTLLRESNHDLTNTFKDSYVFEFLNLPEPHSESDLQRGLVRQMKNFILELGKDKDSEVVEYALSRSLSPTMVSEYKTQLPDKKLLQQKLHELFDN